MRYENGYREFLDAGQLMEGDLVVLIFNPTGSFAFVCEGKIGVANLREANKDVSPKNFIILERPPE